MSREFAVLDIIRTITLLTGPGIIIVSSLLLGLNSNTYSSLEDKLAKEVGGIKKRIMPALETNIYSLHRWMLARKKKVGVASIMCYLLVFLLLKK